MRGRRGFSFPEIMIALVVTSLVAMLAAVSYSTVRRNTADRAAGPVLVSAQLEARRTLDAVGMFPEDLVALMSPLPGVGYVTGAAASGEVSVLRVDDLVAVFAAPGSGGCLVLVDRIGAASSWAFDRTGASRCDAAAAWPVVELLQGGTDSGPLEVSIP
jgi:prepilin-type N-terminal cleavage/methylation domain-containing protein